MRNGTGLRGITRRGLFQGVAAVAGALALPGAARAAWEAVSAVGLADEDFVERHGMSLFGPLEMPPDFAHFPYVNPQAPKGGEFAQQIRQIGLNQNFNTFNTLNTYVLQGDGAAGMDATYDTLMSGSADEPDALYGLVAQSVSRSRDGLVFRWRLRSQARFHDGSPLTAEDVAFSITILRNEGHPNLSQLLRQIESATALGPDLVEVRFVEGRSRDIPLTVAALPIFSKAYWEGRDFTASTLEPPLGSGPYRVGRFEVGRTITFERVEDYWGADLPVNVGLINFDRIRYEYFRDRDVAFEGFKAGQFNYHEESVSRQWARGYDFPAFVQGRVVRENLPTAVPQGPQGWWYNTRLPKFSDKRIREALIYAFDFEWTNENIMFSSYARMQSFFENSELKAEGPPSEAELALLEPYRAGLPDEVFGEAWTPPVSDGSGQDRTLLRRASELLREAGCERRGSVLHLPSGEPFTIEFLDFASFLQPHTQPFHSNLGLLGIQATSRIVDPAQYERRMNEFDFEVTSRRFGASLTPGGSLRLVYGSEAAVTPGTANLSGVQDPTVDALIEIIANAQTREEVVTGGRALDRVLRAGRYMVPAWYKPADWLAYWDEFSRPDTKPRYGTGVGAWWFDPEKAARARRR